MEEWNAALSLLAAYFPPAVVATAAGQAVILGFFWVSCGILYDVIARPAAGHFYPFLRASKLAAESDRLERDTAVADGLIAAAKLQLASLTPHAHTSGPAGPAGSPAPPLIPRPPSA